MRPPEVAEFDRVIAIQDDQKMRTELRMDPATYNYDGRQPIPQRVILMPEFEAIWDEIKLWDVNVPYAHVGYCGASGDHVYAILKALAARNLVALPVEVQSPKGEVK